MTGPITWKQAREDVASLYESLVGARDSANEAVLSPSRDIPVGAEYREAFCDLRWEVDALASRAERLLEMLAESSEPERPDRLAVALAGIVALGHENVSVIRRASPLRWYVQSDNASERWPGSDSGPERIRAYYAAVEQGEAEAAGGDMEAAAQAVEARLAQIRELREQRAAEPVHFAPVFGQDMVCGRSTRWPGVVHTEDPSAVTCPACREWVDTNAVPSEEDIEGFLTAIGAGPEEVDSEHEASAYYDATDILAGTGFIRIEDGQCGRYAVGELAREGDALPWKVVERREGQAPCVIDGYITREAAEAVRDEMNGAAALWSASVEHEPITGPTDAEEDDRATAEHCPQRPGGHEFDSYHVCVHCEYETDADAAELAALARADHERERMASEGEEA